MIRVGIREMRDSFSRFIDRVRKGEHIIITDRGEDLAIVQPLRPSDPDRAWLERLDADGLIESTGSGRPLKPRKAMKLRGKPLSELVVEERRSGW